MYSNQSIPAPFSGRGCKACRTGEAAPLTSPAPVLPQRAEPAPIPTPISVPIRSAEQACVPRQANHGTGCGISLPLFLLLWALLTEGGAARS